MCLDLVAHKQSRTEVYMVVRMPEFCSLSGGVDTHLGISTLTATGHLGYV